MKKIIIGLILLGIIGIVSAEDSFYSELGDLTYLESGSIENNGIYWHDFSSNPEGIIFSVPYTGTYTLDILTTEQFEIYLPNASGTMVQYGEWFYSGTHNITIEKPFFSIVPFFTHSLVYMNSTITLINSDYSNVNYSENQNNTHGVLCPYGKCCDVFRYIETDSKIISVYAKSNVTCNSYDESLGLNLLNYCNIIDANEIVKLRTVSYDTADYFSGSLDYLTYINLNDYMFEYNIFPSNNLILLSSLYNVNRYDIILDDYDILKYGENLSVSWYWDNSLIDLNTFTYHDLNLSKMKNGYMGAYGFMQYNVDNGMHKLKAVAYFNCDIIVDIIWDIEIWGSNESVSTTLTGVVRDSLTWEYLDGVIINLYNENGSYVDTTTTDYIGQYEFKNINYLQNYTIYAHKNNYIDHNKPIFIHNHYQLYNFYMTSYDTKYTIQYFYKDIDSYDFINNFSIIFKNLALGTYLEIENKTQITKYGCDYILGVDNIKITNISEGVYEVIHSSYLYYDYKDSNFVDENTGSWCIYLQNKSLMIPFNISGYVSYNNTFLDDIYIKLLQSPDYNIYRTITTNSVGYYNFSNIPKGNYIIEINDPMYKHSLYGAFILNENKEINISLDSSINLCTLTGHIVMCDKQIFSIENVKVLIISNDIYQLIVNDIYQFVYSDSEGNFKIEVPCGDYYLNFSKIGYVETGLIDLDLNKNWEEYYCLYADTMSSIITVCVDETINTTSGLTDIPVGEVEISVKKNNDLIAQKNTKNNTGCVSFVLLNDNYEFSIKKLGYEVQKENYDIIENRDILFLIKKKSIFSILNEQSVINLIVKYGWFVGLIILILFVTLIIFRLGNNIKKELGGKR